MSFNRIKSILHVKPGSANHIGVLIGEIWRLSELWLIENGQLIINNLKISIFH